MLEHRRQHINALIKCNWGKHEQSPTLAGKLVQPRYIYYMYHMFVYHPCAAIYVVHSVQYIPTPALRGRMKELLHVTCKGAARTKI